MAGNAVLAVWFADTCGSSGAVVAAATLRGVECRVATGGEMGVVTSQTVEPHRFVVLGGEKALALHQTDWRETDDVLRAGGNLIRWRLVRSTVALSAPIDAFALSQLTP